MAEEREGDSKSMWAFLAGFIVGVLVTLGVGAGIFFVGRTSAMRAQMEAEMARDEAERARMMMMEAERAAAAARAEREAAERARNAEKKEEEKKVEEKKDE